MKPSLLFSGAAFLLFTGCSALPQQTSTAKDWQWLCDPSPVIEEWRCQQVAIEASIPIVPGVVQMGPVKEAPAVAKDARSQPHTPVHTERTVLEIMPEAISDTSEAEALAKEGSSVAPAVDVQPSLSGYLVQLAALGSEANAERFFEQHALPSASFLRHKTVSQGRGWYVITSHPVATRRQALALAGGLKATYPQLDTWVRSAASLQRAIRDAGGP
ncbi:SPOR domain-containing protein [bacterium SCSIO 12696]|nr:SPOR domain-containing protein [bacterium SCSIO 12696]